VGSWPTGSIDPVPPPRWHSIRAGHDRFEHASASLDDRGRRPVRFLTRHQDPTHTDSPRDNHTLTQDLGRVSATTELGQHAVPDVPAVQRVRPVERMPDRRATDELTFHVGNEEGGRDNTRRKSPAESMQLESMEVRRPMHARPISDSEGKVLRGHDAFGRHERILIGDGQGPKAKHTSPQEGDDGMSVAKLDRCDLMQEAARKHDRRSAERSVGLVAEFGKAKFAADV
jgi:hypothetical protein